MPVLVEVPDVATSRLARRLIGRRFGVSVEVLTESGASPPKGENVRRIVVGASIGTDRRLGLVRQGIWAILPADNDSINNLLRNYVDDVRSGLCPLLTEITRDHGEVQDLVEVIRRRLRPAKKGEVAENPLSERETEILQHIAYGVTSREIAEEMGFQLQTVKNKVTAILTKTHARSRSHAVSIALTSGWITSP